MLWQAGIVDQRVITRRLINVVNSTIKNSDQKSHADSYTGHICFERIFFPLNERLLLNCERHVACASSLHMSIFCNCNVQSPLPPKSLSPATKPRGKLLRHFVPIPDHFRGSSCTFLSVSLILTCGEASRSKIILLSSVFNNQAMNVKEKNDRKMSMVVLSCTILMVFRDCL